MLGHFEDFVNLRSLRCQTEVLSSSFIDFNSKSLTNSLWLLPWHVVTPFLLSTDHVHFHILSNIPKTVCYIFLFWFLTSSTLYSSSLLIISDNSAEFMCCSLKCSFLHYVSRSSLNILWIIHSSGNSIWNAS